MSIFRRKTCRLLYLPSINQYNFRVKVPQQTKTKHLAPSPNSLYSTKLQIKWLITNMVNTRISPRSLTSSSHLSRREKKAVMYCSLMKKLSRKVAMIMKSINSVWSKARNFSGIREGQTLKTTAMSIWPTFSMESLALSLSLIHQLLKDNHKHRRLLLKAQRYFRANK